MNAFWASENCEAFIVFRSFPARDNTAENSNPNWSSFMGSDHFRICGIMRATLSGLVTSTLKEIACGPSFAQTVFNASSSLSTRMTRAPSQSSFLEHSRPMPEAAPVIAATFPDKLSPTIFPSCLVRLKLGRGKHTNGEPVRRQGLQWPTRRLRMY